MLHWTKPKKRTALAICAVCTFLAICLHFQKTFDYGMRDLLIRLGKKAPQDPQLIFLAIDTPTLNVGTSVFRDDIEKSPALKKMSEGWPWSRDTYASIIERLANSGAKVIAFDETFPAPRTGDEEFRTALDKYRSRVVIGSNFEKLENVPTYQAPSPTLIPPPTEADDRVGFANLWTMDKVDGKLRTARYRISGREYFHKEDRRVFESLAARVLRKARYADAIPGGEVGFRFPAIGTGHEFERHSLYSIFIPHDWETKFQNGAIFKDKIVLIGPYGTTQKDQVPTPYGDIDGPLVHLSIINAALQNDFLAYPPFFEEIILVILAGVGAFSLSLAIRLPVKRFSLMLVGSAVYLVAVKVLADFDGHLLPVLTPMVAFFGSGVVIFVKQIREEQMEKSKLREKMERFLSKEIVNQIIENPSSVLKELGGVRKPVTLLRTDLRQFTTKSESADPAQTLLQLNEYFSEMARIVLGHRGAVDKFIGDSIVAIWGGIHSEGVQHDAELAALAAMEMQAAMAKLNEGWRERGLPELEMGIGINSGEATFGNIGCKEKMEPTVIGDTVDVTDRMDDIAKEYGVKIILSEKTAALVGGVVHLLIVDRIQLKGATRINQVYTLLGPRHASLGDGVAKYLEIYKTGLVHYQAGRFKEAKNAFALCLTFRENDPLAQLYVNRCIELDRNHPENWTGVYGLQSH